jgi:hypothetical protein
MLRVRFEVILRHYPVTHCDDEPVPLDPLMRA